MFLQILYKRQFYTANLLLFNRFMLLLPALIVAYYMLYLIKSHALAGDGPVVRGPVTIVAFACFFYTAWAWTENHVLSLHEEVVEDTSMRRSIISIAMPRSGRGWVTGSRRRLRLWRSRWPGSFTGAGASTTRSTWISRPAGCGRWRSWDWRCRPPRPGSGCSGSTRPPGARDPEQPGLPYGLMALAGIGIQVAGWLPVKAGADLTTRRLALHLDRRVHDDPRRPGRPRGAGAWPRSISPRSSTRTARPPRWAGWACFSCFSRCNASVELERTIKENEFKTEIIVAEKQRMVSETKMAGEIAVEQQRSQLVETRTANERKEAEARGASLHAILAPVRDVDWRVLLAVQGDAHAGTMISSAFDQLARNAERIGQLNITPDLLQSLLPKPATHVRQRRQGPQRQVICVSVRPSESRSSLGRRGWRVSCSDGARAARRQFRFRANKMAALARAGNLEQAAKTSKASRGR